MQASQMPSRSEIQRRCAEIQRGWDTETRESRRRAAGKLQRQLAQLVVGACGQGDLELATAGQAA